MNTPARWWHAIGALLCCFGFAAAAGAVEVVGTVAEFKWDPGDSPGPVAYYHVEVNRYNGEGWQPPFIVRVGDRASITGEYGESIRVRVQAVAMDLETTSEYSPVSDLVTFVETKAADEEPPEPPDLCPDDPNKTKPGLCGCGESDVDTDGDGTPDCHDLCEKDSNKTERGLCGCGKSDKDTDGDGTPDCHDLCEKDSNKTEPGLCGCGKSDKDSDGDGTPDCLDDPEPAKLLDFTADGRADLLIRSPSTDVIELWLPVDSSPAWIEAGLLDRSFKIVGNADYDGDGYADLLAHDPATGVLEIRLLENGQTVETGSFQIDSDWEVVGSADYDGNGYADFLLRDRQTHDLQFWSLHGTEVREIVPLKRLPYADAEILGSGDYDGDGRHDILWRTGAGTFQDSDLFVWYLDDPAKPIEEEAPPIEWGWQAVGTGDYDGDGTSDLLLYEEQSGDLRMYLFGSDSVSEEDLQDNSKYFPSRNRSQYTVVGSADFDGDGRCDIALRSRYGALLLLYMEGYQAQRGLSLDDVPESVQGVGLENPASD